MKLGAEQTRNNGNETHGDVIQVHGRLFNFPDSLGEREYLPKIAPLFTAFKKILSAFVCQFGTYAPLSSSSQNSTFMFSLASLD